MKKILSMVLCIVLSLFAVACDNSGDGDSSNVSETTADGKVVIGIPQGWGGGAGNDYIESLMKAFNEDPAWGNQPIGKYKGAYVKLLPQDIPSTPAKIETSGADIFGTSYLRDARTAEAYVVDLDDMMREVLPGEDQSIHDKIPEQYREVFTGANGRYVAVPGESLYCGYTIDTEMFEREQLYIAAAYVGSEEETIDSALSSYRSYYSAKFGIRLYFSDYDGDGLHKYGIGGGKCETNGQFQTEKDDLSCGPDGEFGTNDDGMPSSVIEFLGLCDYIRSADFASRARTTFYAPVTLSGTYRDSYANSYLDGLYASLAGDLFEKCVQCFDSQGAKVRVVTGYTDENLYPGISYLKKPIIEEVVITPETGYYTTWMEDKFYAEASLEILHKEGYFGYSEQNDVNHKDTHCNFLFGAYDDKNFRESCAFLIEGSFWSMESDDYDAYQKIYRADDAATNRRTEVAPMPVNINEPVTEGNGDQNTFVADMISGDAINKKVESDPDKLAYCKLYLQYTMTEVALAYKFNRSHFDPICLRDYNAVMDNPDNAEFINKLPFLTSYYNEYHFQRLGQLQSESRRVYGVGDLEGPINFRTQMTYYRRLYASGVFSVGGTQNCYSKLRAGWKADQKIGNTISTFESHMKTKETWSTMYPGYSEVPDSQKSYNNVTYTQFNFSKYQ